jgi:hypothetical protein
MDAEKIFSNKKSSNRGIADDQPVVVDDSPAQPTVLDILDALGYFIDKRFNDIEAKLDNKGCKCQKK